MILSQGIVNFRINTDFLPENTSIASLLHMHIPVCVNPENAPFDESGHLTNIFSPISSLHPDVIPPDRVPDSALRWRKPRGEIDYDVNVNT